MERDRAARVQHGSIAHHRTFLPAGGKLQVLKLQQRVVMKTDPLQGKVKWRIKKFEKK